MDSRFSQKLLLHATNYIPPTLHYPNIVIKPLPSLPSTLLPHHYNSWFISLSLPLQLFSPLLATAIFSPLYATAILSPPFCHSNLISSLCHCNLISSLCHCTLISSLCHCTLSISIYATAILSPPYLSTLHKKYIHCLFVCLFVSSYSQGVEYWIKSDP